jgi:hypothetical protein
MEDAIIHQEKKNPLENDLGLLFWKVESIEHFIPCYKTMMKQE